MTEQPQPQYKYLVFMDTSYNYNVASVYRGGQTSNVRTKAVKFQSAIYKDCDTFDLASPDSRWFMVLRHPLHNRAIIQTAKMEFNSHIAFYKDADGTDEDHDLERKFVVEQKGHIVFQNHKINVDAHGWSAIGKFTHPVTGKPTVMAVSEPKYHLKKDETSGFVKGISYIPAGQNEEKVIPLDDVIYHAKDDLEYTGEGTTALAAAWDDSIWWALTMFAMAEYDARLGNGIHVVKVPQDIDSTAEDKVKTQYENLTGRRYVMAYVSGDPNGTYGTEIVPPAQVDYPAHLDKMLESVASSYGLPVSFFKGGAEGAMSTAGENGLMVKDRLEADFDEYVPDLLEFLNRFMGVSGKTPDEKSTGGNPAKDASAQKAPSSETKPIAEPNSQTPASASSGGLPSLIEPRIELRMNELARAEVDATKAQASTAKMRWMSVAEIRKEWGLEGDVVPAQMEQDQAMLDKAGEVKAKSDKANDKNADGKQKQPEGKSPKEKFTDAVASSTFDVSVTVKDKKDVWELEGTLGGEGFVDYSDVGRGTIYRSADAVAKAAELAANSTINVGIEHVDGKAGEEVYNTSRVGVVTRLNKSGNQLMVKMAVEKKAVDDYFAARNEPNWVREAIEKDKALKISAGAVGSLKGTTQDLWEVRSVAITKNPRVKNAIVSLIEPPAQ